MEAATFEGDSVDAAIADLSRWRGQLIRLRFTLDRAALRFRSRVTFEGDSVHLGHGNRVDLQPVARSANSG